MNSYLDGLKEAVEALHNCKATHIDSVPLTEAFLGEAVWDGVVEVFTVEGHPTATRCFVWGYVEGEETKIMAILDIPPVDSPKKAVQVGIASQARGKKK